MDAEPRQAGPAGWGALLSGANGIRSLALAGGVALHAIDVYIATTILPSVVRDIGGIEYYAWTTTLFVMASILGSALATRLLGAVGPRGAYAAAAAVFALGTLASALAPSMPALIGGRFVQGFGGGLLLSLSYAMIRLVFAPPLWPRAMALVSGMWGAATLIGPAVGGVFAELDAWRAAFWSLLPAIALFASVAVAVLPRRQASASAPAPVALPQLGLLMLAVLAISAGSVHPSLAWNLAGVAVAAAASLALRAVEERARHRLLPAGALRPGTPLGALFATLSLLAVTVTSSEIFAPLFLQVLHRQAPLAAGYLAAVMSAGWTLGALVGSGLGGRAVARVIAAAPLAGLAGMAALALLVPPGSDGSAAALAPIAVALTTVGVGVGLAWPHVLTAVLRVAEPAEQELASASITTVQLFTTALGAALAGMVANLGGLTTPGGVAGTAGAARWLFATFTLAPLVCLVSARRVRARVPLG